MTNTTDNNLRSSLGVVVGTPEQIANAQANESLEEVLDPYTSAQKAVRRLGMFSRKDSSTPYETFLTLAKEAYGLTNQLEVAKLSDYDVIVGLYQGIIDASVHYLDALRDKKRGAEIAKSIQRGTFSLRKR